MGNKTGKGLSGQFPIGVTVFSVTQWLELEQQKGWSSWDLTEHLFSWSLKDSHAISLCGLVWVPHSLVASGQLNYLHDGWRSWAPQQTNKRLHCLSWLNLRGQCSITYAVLQQLQVSHEHNFQRKGKPTPPLNGGSEWGQEIFGKVKVAHQLICFSKN